jgi:hypothetical protein
VEKNKSELPNQIKNTMKNKTTRKRGARPDIKPDYGERAEITARTARDELIKQAGQLWRDLQKGKTILSETGVTIVNLASQLGGVVLQICDSNQLTFALWTERCAEQLPFIKLDAAMELVSVHKKVPHPIANISEIWPVWKQVNLALGTLQIPERAEQNEAAEVSPLTAICNTLGKAVVALAKWEQSEPLSTWPSDRLETFAFETKKIHDKHVEALGILKSKGIVL